MVRILLVVAGAGAVGGLLNALVSGAGVLIPRVADVEGAQVLIPGFVGNLVVGGIAALVFYGLYGPVASHALLGKEPAGPSTAEAYLTLAAFTGAVLVGFSGGRWLTAEAEKRLNHGTATVLAQAVQKMETRRPKSLTNPSDELAIRSAIAELRQKLESGRPVDAFEKAKELDDLLSKP